MPTTEDKVAALAPDLTTGFPRSPRDTVAGYVLAARLLDKCRATLAGRNGEYHYNCSLDKIFFAFAGLDAEAFKAFVATGATDDEVAAWIEANATKRERIEIVRWNNGLRERRIGELEDRLQLYFEDYIPKHCPPGARINVWFDVYDYEEGRLKP